MKLHPAMIAVFAASLTATAVPASAQTAVSASEASRSADDNQIVCKRQKRANSRFEDKTCKTRSQWEQMRVQHQRDAREMLDRPKICGGGGSMEGC